MVPTSFILAYIRLRQSSSLVRRMNLYARLTGLIGSVCVLHLISMSTLPNRIAPPSLAQALTQDVAFLIDCLKGSEVVELSKDHISLRPLQNPTSWPITGEEQHPVASIHHLNSPQSNFLHPPSSSSSAIKFNPDVPEFVPGKMTKLAGMSCHINTYLFLCVNILLRTAHLCTLNNCTMQCSEYDDSRVLLYILCCSQCFAVCASYMRYL